MAAMSCERLQCTSVAILSFDSFFQAPPKLSVHRTSAAVVDAPVQVLHAYRPHNNHHISTVLGTPEAAPVTR